MLYLFITVRLSKKSGLLTSERFKRSVFFKNEWLGDECGSWTHIIMCRGKADSESCWQSKSGQCNVCALRLHLQQTHSTSQNQAVLLCTITATNKPNFDINFLKPSIVMKKQRQMQVWLSYFVVLLRNSGWFLSWTNEWITLNGRQIHKGVFMLQVFQKELQHIEIIQWKLSKELGQS